MKRALWTYLLLVGTLIPLASQAFTLPRSGGKTWWDQVSCACCSNIYDSVNQTFTNLQYGPKQAQGVQDNAGNGSYEIEAICNRYINTSGLSWNFRVKAVMTYEAASGIASEFVEIYLFNQNYTDDIWPTRRLPRCGAMRILFLVIL